MLAFSGAVYLIKDKWEVRMSEILDNDTSGIYTELFAEPHGIGQIVERGEGGVLVCDITVPNDHPDPSPERYIINLSDPNVTLSAELKPGMVMRWKETMVLKIEGKADEEIASDRYFLNPAQGTDELPLG
jgi:hypothetical protein